MLQRLPQLQEWTFWGRIIEAKDAASLYSLPQEVNGCKVSYLGPSVNKKARWLWGLWIAESLYSFKRRLAQSDILFLKMPCIFPCLACHLVGQGKVVISLQVGDPEQTVRVMFPRMRWFGSLIGRYCRRISIRADRAFFVSNALRTLYDLSKQGMVSNESRVTMEMIRTGSSGEVHRPPRIVFVGRLSAEKGVFVLLDAISRVLETLPLELWIIGSGDLRQELENSARSLGISESVKWLGWMPWGSALFEKLGQADTLVLPSFSEGLPLVLAEAMSQGLVVVASAVGGIPEILENGEAGILVPPGDVKALASAIRQSVTDTALRRPFIQAGFAQAKKNCLEAQTGLIMDEIQRLIQQKSIAGKSV